MSVINCPMIISRCSFCENQSLTTHPQPECYTNAKQQLPCVFVWNNSRSCQLSRIYLLHLQRSGIVTARMPLSKIVRKFTKCIFLARSELRINFGCRQFADLMLKAFGTWWIKRSLWLLVSNIFEHMMGQVERMNFHWCTS